MARSETASAEDSTDPVALSSDLLYAVKTGGDYASYRDRLGTLDRDELLAALDADGERKAFWLNVYNAAVQYLLDEDETRYDDRRSFYSTKYLTVAGESLSLDEVEHGILRAGQSSVGLGYLEKPDFLASDFIRAARVDRVDPRIHFALNCGAAACPPIATYTADGIEDELALAAEGIEDELALAAESYLHAEVEYDPDGRGGIAARLPGRRGDGVARVPRLMLWFRGDFGGKRGIYRHLWEYGPVPEGAAPTVKYKSYDWSLQLDTYRTDERE